MSNEIQELKEKIGELEKQIELQGCTFTNLSKNKSFKEYAEKLGVNAERFAHGTNEYFVNLDDYQKEKIRNCTPKSINQFFMTCLSLNLYLGSSLGHCYPVPRNLNRVLNCTFVPGYKGLIEIAEREPSKIIIFGHAVRRQDEFDVSYGTDEKITHKPKFNVEGDNPIVGAYAIATYPNGLKKSKVLDRKYIEEQVRPKKKDGSWLSDKFWGKNPEPMYIKSAIINLCKFISGKSAQLNSAIELDNKQYNTIEGEKTEKQEKVIENPAQHVLADIGKMEETIDMSADMTKVTEKEAIEAIDSEIPALLNSVEQGQDEGVNF